jgi:CBS domain-containing protein
MHVKHVSGVAIVNEEGRIIKNLSASDIRAVQGGHNLERLVVPVSEFALERKLITLRPDDVFMQAIRVLAQNRLHHAFIVDEHNHPIGTVSLTDVLRVVAHAAQVEAAAHQKTTH